MYERRFLIVPELDNAILMILTNYSQRRRGQDKRSITRSLRKWGLRIDPDIIQESLHFLEYYQLAEEGPHGYAPTLLGKGYLRRN